MERGITDPRRLRVADKGDPYNGCRSVYRVHEIITPHERESRYIANRCLNADIGCVECKKILVESIRTIIEPFQERRRELSEASDYALDVLHEGGKQARAIIAETLEAVREKMGILVY